MMCSVVVGALKGAVEVDGGEVAVQDERESRAKEGQEGRERALSEQEG